MKNLKIMSMQLIVSALCFGLTSCGPDDEPVEPVDNPYNTNNSYNTEETNNTENANNQQAEESVEQKVMKNISAYISPYSNYYFNISITSTIASVLPQKNIKYLVECGYGEYSVYVYADKNNKFPSTYNIQSYNDDSGFHTQMSLSIFDGGSPYEMESWYVRTYLGLLKKQSEGESLNSDEIACINYWAKKLPEQEVSAKRDFIGRLCVEIDGRRYYYKYFTCRN